MNAPQQTVTWSNNWMSGLNDDAIICEISIPGTHDSGARFGRQCQWFSIIQQLNRGIRFLDIRCKYGMASESGRTQNLYFAIHHASSFQKILFEEVQAQCIAFLSANPTEFILMNVQEEQGRNGDDFRQKFLQITKPYQENYWYMKNGLRMDSDLGSIPDLPTVKDVRGRIVLIRAYDQHTKEGWASGIDIDNPETREIWPDGFEGGGFEWNGFSSQNDGESSSLLFETQNGWTKWHGTQKGDEVEQYIKSAATNAAQGKLTLNFASYAIEKGPEPNAERMNPRIQGFLKNPQSGVQAPLGVVVLDFTGNTGDTGNSLENLIIATQKHQRPDHIYAGLSDWLVAQYQ